MTSYLCSDESDRIERHTVGLGRAVMEFSAQVEAGK